MVSVLLACDHVEYVHCEGSSTWRWTMMRTTSARWTRRTLKRRCALDIGAWTSEIAHEQFQHLEGGCSNGGNCPLCRRFPCLLIQCPGHCFCSWMLSEKRVRIKAPLPRRAQRRWTRTAR